jgi:hypothetical protein
LQNLMLKLKVLRQECERCTSEMCDKCPTLDSIRELKEDFVKTVKGGSGVGRQDG